MKVDTNNLYWFHAFERGSPGEIVRVLVEGADPYSNPTTSTSRNEAELGITPARVYAYLGRTCDAFGHRAVAIQFGAVTGELSPFDTGGLVGHIQPVCRWSPPQAKSDFLQSYTWNFSDISGLLTDYPGEKLVAYLQLERPEPADPSEVWSNRHASAQLWSEPANEWRAWTWEIRSPDRLPTGTNLVGWACEPTERQTILNALLDGALEENELWIDLLAEKFVNGGVATLIKDLQHRQVAAHA